METKKIDIKDYLHLYIGCELRAPHPQDLGITKGYLTGIHGEYGPEVQFVVNGNAEEEPDYPGIENIKLVLRRLSDMTEEDGTKAFGDAQKFRLYRKEREENNGDLWLFTPNETKNLLKLGFDLFDLIPAGLAIDKTSLKN